MRVIMPDLKIRVWISVDSNPKGSKHQPKHFNRPLFLGPQPSSALREIGLGPQAVFPTSSYKPFPSQSLITVSPDLTRAPLLSRIMKMMKVSNQLCSTMRKHVFRRIHQDLPRPSSMLTVQHLNRRTQPGTSGRGRSGREHVPPSPLSPSPTRCCPTTQLGAQQMNQII